MKKTKLTLQEVQKLHQAGQLKEARVGYLAILESNPNEWTALHLLGVLYAEEGALEEAQNSLEKALQLNPKDKVLYLHLANVLKAKGLFSQAAQLLTELISHEPKFAAAYNNLGTVYYAQAKLQPAVDAFQTAIDLQPDYVDAYYNLGLTFTKLNQDEKAVNAYKALLELAPNHPGGQFHLGCLWMKQMQYSSAIEQFSKIEHHHPFHFETLCNLGTCYLNLGKFNEAKQHYLKALEIQPADEQVLFNLGVISISQGQVDAAIQFYLDGIKIDPDLYDAHNNLAYIYLTMQKNESALLHFQECLRLQPNNESIRHTIKILTGEKNVSTSPPEYVRSLFNSYADHFDAHLLKGLHYQVPQMIYQAFSETVDVRHANFDILDLGCGTGLSGELFKPYAKSLTGVDISEKMLEIAAKKNIYTSLIQADILPFLQNEKEVYDLIIGSDVFVYFGELAPIFSAIYQALRFNGRFVFNTEISETAPYSLSKSGRFLHREEYIEQLAHRNRLTIVQYKKIIMRTQNQMPVYGHLFVLKK